MKITTLISLTLLLPVISALSNCSGNQGAVDAFDRIALQDPYVNFNAVVNKRQNRINTPALHAQSIFLSNLTFDTLESAISEFNKNPKVGMWVSLPMPIETSETELYDELLSDKGKGWGCKEGVTEVSCEKLSQGYPQSLVSIDYQFEKTKCRANKCVYNENNRPAKAPYHVSMPTAIVVLTVKNSHGEFTATSLPLAQQKGVGGIWDIDLSDVHSDKQVASHKQKYPNSESASSIDFVTVEGDLAELIFVKDEVRKAPIEVAKAFMDKELASDISNVNGLDKVSVINVTKLTLDMLLPLIVIVVLFMVYIKLGKVDMKLLNGKELTEDEEYSVLYSRKRRDRVVKYSLFSLLVVTCIVPAGLMSITDLVSVSNMVGVNLNEKLAYPWLQLIYNPEEAGLSNLIFYAMFLACAAIMMSAVCISVIRRQRATIEETETPHKPYTLNSVGISIPDNIKI